MGNCLFVLCEFNHETKRYVPLATTFAVACKSNTLLLTCHHSVVDEFDKPLENLIVCTSVVRKNRKFVCENIINVEILSSNKKYDWAILKRKDSFTFESTLKIRTDSVENCALDIGKTYYYDVKGFLETSDPALVCASTDYEKIEGLTDHHVKFRRGFPGGSSGSPTIDRDYNLFAMHQESVNQVKEVNIKENHTYEEKLEIIEDFALSSVRNHTSVSYSLYICKFKNLVKFLAKN